MMTNAECRAALAAHMNAERARDIEAIVDSVHEDCVWLITGWELRGKPAIRAFYERSLPSLTAENMDEYERALDDPAVATWGPQHVVLTYTSDYPVHYGMVVVTRFRDGKVIGEDTFFNVARGDDPQAFVGVPGAVRVEPGPSAIARR